MKKGKYTLYSIKCKYTAKFQELSKKAEQNARHCGRDGKHEWNT